MIVLSELVPYPRAALNDRMELLQMVVCSLID